MSAPELPQNPGETPIFAPGQQVITDRGEGTVLDWAALEEDGLGFIIDPSQGHTLEECKIVPDEAYREANRLVHLPETDSEWGGTNAVYTVHELTVAHEQVLARIANNLRIDKFAQARQDSIQ